MIQFNPFCLSSYLTFRYVAKKGNAWVDHFEPEFLSITADEQIGIRNSNQIQESLRKVIMENMGERNTGILLSGGIDSAILASFMPRGTPAYTIRFLADNAIDESGLAQQYADQWQLKHHIVEVTWDDYLEFTTGLMKNKKSPLHPVEVGLYKAATEAYSAGIRTLFIGNGADSTFGGMDKLLSRDWTFDEFIKRYTFVDPFSVLKEPISMVPVFKSYRKGKRFDCINFLKIVHGLGIIQAFDNAIGYAGCRTIEPYENLRLDVPLDLARIRSGESKYLLRSVFRDRFPCFEIPEKVAFARPMDSWMGEWPGPTRHEFLEELDMTQFTGEQKWLIYCLERFLNLVEAPNV